MDKMEQILFFLKGKKGVLATIFTAINGYLFATGVLSEPAFVMLATITAALFGVASYGTRFMYEQKELSLMALQKKITEKE